MSTLRWAAWPSSSMAKQPHSPPIVPSSTMVTPGVATRSPTRPLNTEALLPTRSASSPWPHASWNSTPPPPEPMTTGICPLGAGRAASLVRARCGRPAGQLVDVVEVEQLEADGVADALAAGLHAGVAGGHARHGEERLDLVVGGQQAVAVGHQDLAAAVAVAGRHLADGAALGPGGLVGPVEQLDLAGLGHVARQDARPRWVRAPSGAPARRCACRRPPTARPRPRPRLPPTGPAR